VANQKKHIQQRDIITSIERGFNVLRAFDQQSTEMTPADVAKHTNLPRATARRILLTFEQLGYAIGDGKSFCLTPKVLDLAHGYLAKANVVEMIEPILSDAKDKTQESCALLIRDGIEMICIASSNPGTIGYVPFPTGTRVPLHIGSSGRVLLASLPEQEVSEYVSNIKLVRTTLKTIVKKADLKKEIDKVRRNGYSLTVDEFSIGIFGMAVPVDNRSQHVIASVACLGNTARVSGKKARDNILAVLGDASQRISSILPDDYEFPAGNST
jgi:IclR family pca regulon transcriptional regulator